MLTRWVVDKQREEKFRTDTPAETLAAQYISLAVSAPQLRYLVGFSTPLQADELSIIVDEAASVFLDGALTDRDRYQHA